MKSIIDFSTIKKFIQNDKGFIEELDKYKTEYNVTDEEVVVNAHIGSVNKAIIHIASKVEEGKDKFLVAVVTGRKKINLSTKDESEFVDRFIKLSNIVINKEDGSVA